MSHRLVGRRRGARLGLRHRAALASEIPARRGGLDARKLVATATTTVLSTFGLFGRELGPRQFSDGFELGDLEAWSATGPAE